MPKPRSAQVSLETTPYYRCTSRCVYPDNMPRTLNNKNIVLAGTEVARENAGYLEGALESADEALALLS